MVREYFAIFTSATIHITGRNEGLITGAFTWGLLPGPPFPKTYSKETSNAY